MYAISFICLNHFAVAKCQPLDHPSNGHVLHLSDGKIAVFYCNTGYTLTDPIILQCSGGKWNSSPLCSLHLITLQQLQLHYKTIKQ